MKAAARHPDATSIIKKLEHAAPQERVYYLGLLSTCDGHALSLLGIAAMVAGFLNDADWAARATACDVLAHLDLETLEPFAQSLSEHAASDPVIGVRWEARKALKALDGLCRRWSVEQEDSASRTR